MFDDACNSKRLDLRVREDNPSRDVRGPDRGITRAKAYLFPTELLQVVSCDLVDLPMRRAIALAVYTYARASELRALT